MRSDDLRPSGNVEDQLAALDGAAEGVGVSQVAFDAFEV